MHFNVSFKPRCCLSALVVFGPLVAALVATTDADDQWTMDDEWMVKLHRECVSDLFTADTFDLVCTLDSTNEINYLANEPNQGV